MQQLELFKISRKEIPKKRKEVRMYRRNNLPSLFRRDENLSEIARVIKILALEDEPLFKIKPKFDELVDRIEEKLIKYYSVGEGRPAYSIKRILGMLLIQRMYNINSDRAICRLCLTDALFRYFIGCDSFRDPIPDDTTLVKFRKRLGKEGFREIFDELVKLIKESKKISNFRIIDATYINAMGKKFGMIKFIKEGIKKALKIIIEKNKEIGTILKKKFNYLRIKTKRSARSICKKFIAEVSSVRGLPEKAKKIINALELSLKGNPVVNFLDLDARWGHKSSTKKFAGYKGEIMIDKNGFVTSYRVLPGNVCEGKDISPLIEYEKNKLKLKIDEISGDRLYASGPNLSYLKKKKIKGYFPNRTRYSQIDKFLIEGNKVVCPMGKLPKGSISQENGTLFYWSAKECKKCPLKSKCVSPHESRKKVYLSELKSMKLEERRDKLKQRNQIERIFAHAVHHGARNNWYVGLNKCSIHLALVFTLLNLERLCN